MFAKTLEGVSIDAPKETLIERLQDAYDGFREERFDILSVVEVEAEKVRVFDVEYVDEA